MSFLKNKKLQSKKYICCTNKISSAFRKGLRHEIYEPNKDKYKGEWYFSKKEGKGCFINKFGYTYENDWFKNLRWGYGIDAKITQNKLFDLIYIGDWIRDHKDGYGRLRYKDGSLYEGQFSSSLRNGIGFQWYSNGDYYEGEWKNDNPEGFGIYIQANGNRYEGEWKCGIKHGKGIFLHLDSGQIQRGVWSFGTCKISKMYDLNWRQSAEFPTEYPLRKGRFSDDIYMKKKLYILYQNDKKPLECIKKEKNKKIKLDKEMPLWIPCFINIKKPIPSPYF